MVPVEGPERSVVLSPLDPNHKYRFTLFGIADKKRYGPLTADGTTGEWLPPTLMCPPLARYTLTLSQEPDELSLPAKWLIPTPWPCAQAEGQPASPEQLGPFHPVQHAP